MSRKSESALYQGENSPPWARIRTPAGRLAQFTENPVFLELFIRSRNTTAPKAARLTVALGTELVSAWATPSELLTQALERSRSACANRRETNETCRR
jgi:hypothetical protein